MRRRKSKSANNPGRLYWACSKGLFDKLQTVVYTPKGKEKRVDIEAMSLKEGAAESGNRLM